MLSSISEAMEVTFLLNEVAYAEKSFDTWM